MAYSNEIHNLFSYAKRQGTADNDTIFNYGDHVTLNGGGGNDLITLGGSNEVVQYNSGGGNDTVLGADFTTTLDSKFDSVEWTGADIIVRLDNGSITLKDLNDPWKFIDTIFGSENDDSIIGQDTLAEDTIGLQIMGGYGNDTIRNFVRYSTLVGGTGNDSIRNDNEDYYGSSTISGGDGNDTIINRGHNVTINGGKGNDLINLHSERNATLQYADGDGDDTVIGISDNLTFDFKYDSFTRQGSDIIVPIGSGSITFKNGTRDSRFENVLRGTDGDDLLINDKGYFTVAGGKGNDTLFNNNGIVNLNGGEGDDVISLGSDGFSYIEYSLNGGNDTVFGYNEWNGQLTFDYDSIEEVGDDVLVHVGNGSVLFKNTTRARVAWIMRGSDGNDNIRNSSRVKYIVGGKGNDNIRNEAGSATLDGGNGDDYIVNYGDRAMYVSIRGGAGNDNISAGGQYSTVDGGEGNDVINNTGWKNLIDGGNGNDSITNGDGYYDNYSTIYGGKGNDTLVNTVNYATLGGGEGNDYLSNDHNWAVLNGDEGNDTIVNSGYFSTLDGGAGSDVISLNNSRAVVLHSGGNDSIYGYDDYTTLGFYYDSVSRAGNDVIMRGGNGSVTFKNLSSEMLDRLAPIAASDAGATIYNEDGWKNILGGAGNDSIYHFYGTSVTINGAGGNDTIINERGGAASLLGGTGDDYIYTDDYATVDGGDGNDTIINSENSLLKGGKGNDLIIDTNKSLNYSTTINGGAGIDTVSITGGNCIIEYASGDGNDLIYGFNELTTLNFKYDALSQSGNDVVVKVGNGSLTLKDTPLFLFNDRITGSYNRDNITNSKSNKYITTYAGSDSINNTGSHVIINAGDGDDTIGSRRGAHVSINGGRGNEKIVVEGDYITIKGGAGNDSIYIVSESAAVIQYESGDGNDTIRGFDNDKSTLDFNIDGIRQSGSNVIATVGKGTITFQNTSINKVIPKVNGTGGNDVITNEKNFAVVNAGGGNDTVVNSGVNVVINGGAGNDVISLNGGSARIEHTSGNDTVYGFDSDTTLGFSYDSIAQSGADVIMKNNNGSVTIKDTSIETFIATVSGTDGNDRLVNSTPLRHIDAGAGNDTVENSASDVTIDAGIGNDLISLNGGSAIIQHSDGDGNDTIIGFDNRTTLNFDYDLARQSGNDVILASADDEITFKNAKIENFKSTLAGTDGNDLLIGGKTLASIVGGNGNDTITNAASNVTINGGQGNDLISLNGGASARIEYRSGDGNDTIIGFDFNDTLAFDYDAVEQSGDDVIVTVGSGTITFKDVTPAQVLEKVNGTDGNDRINNTANRRYIDAGAGNDTITNTGSTVVINGGKGNDLISLNGGSAQIEYESGDGNDTIVGYNSNTALNVEYDAIVKSGNDVIMAVGDGSITIKDTSIVPFIGGIVGTDGDDALTNDEENKYIDAGAGNDTITNTGSNATLVGGAGNDVISLDGGSARIEYQSGDGNDTIYGFDSDTTLGFSYDSVVKTGDDVVMRVGNASLTFKDTSIAHFINGIVGTDGRDNLSNSDADKYIDGRSSNDTVNTTGDNVTVEGGAGNDRINLLGGNNVSINGGAGSDLISLGGGSARIFYKDGDGSDLIYGYDSMTTLEFAYDSIERSGSDVAMKVGNSSITFKNTSLARFIEGVIGTDEDETIANSASSKYVDAREGNDTITNSGSNATLVGGAGDDVISLTGGSARIDYQLGEGNDTVYGYNDRTTLGLEYSEITKSGADAVMRSGDGSVTIKDTSIAKILGGVVGSGGNDNLSNSDAGKYIDAGAGNDTITNTASDATLDGGAGNDVINLNGGSAVVRYFDGDGNDTVLGAGANTTLDTEYDSINVTSDAIILKRGDGSITLKNLTAGFSFEDTLFGSNGDDSITNSEVGKYIIGGAGNDVISLDGAAVIEYSSGDGNDTIYGFDSDTTLDFDYDSVAKSGADVVMKVGNGSITFKNTSVVQFMGGVEGTDDNDNLSNADADKYIDGRAGNDIITNSGDNATIDGGAGDDVINLSGGSARIAYQSGDGNDTIFGFNANTTLDFDYDSVTQSGADVIMKVGDGSITFKDTDLMTLLPRIVGTDGADSISNADDLIYIDALAGNDTVTNSGSNVTINGGAGNDVISLNGGAAFIQHSDGDGNDTVIGYNDRTTLGLEISSIGQSGENAILYVGDGSITFQNTDLLTVLPKVSGTNGANYLTNDAAFRYIDCGKGNDTVINSGAGSTINGEDGANHIENSGANVYINGGNGSADIINSGDNTSIFGSMVNDTINNSGSGVLLHGNAGDDTITSSGENVTINGDIGSDVISLHGGSEVILYDQGGFGEENDTVYGASARTTLGFKYNSISKSGNDVIANIYISKWGSITFKDASMAYFVGGIAGTDGDDTLSNSEDKKYVDGRSGNDTLINSGAGSTVDGGTGDDVISLNGGSARIEYASGDGNDTIYGFDSDTTIGFSYDTVVRSGSDVIMPVGDGSITFKDTSIGHFIGGKVGTDGDDAIDNGEDEKYVDGRAGNDTLTNSGDDVTLNGGAGNDVISLDGGSAVIEHASGDGSDTIYGFDELTGQIGFGYDTLEETGNDVVVRIGDDEITVKDTTSDRITSVQRGTKGDDALRADTRAKYVVGGKGNDTVVNEYGNKVLRGGKGNDYLVSQGEQAMYVVLKGDADDDTLRADGNYATLDGGKGDDSIVSESYFGVVDGGKGNDTITNSGLNATVAGGKGDDVINLVGGRAVINYKSGDGNDTVYGYNDNTTLGFEYDTIERAGDDVIMTVGKGTLTFKGLDEDMINRMVPIVVVGDKVTNEQSGRTILGSNGDDTIENSGSKVTINGSGGNDRITNSGYDAFILGGAGNDTVANSDDNSTIAGGAGDDVISLVRGRGIVNYATGDGNDVIIGFSEQTTLGFDYDTIEQTGNDAVLTVGDGTITLKDTSMYLLTGRINGGAFANDSINNRSSNKYITTGSGGDTITNRGSNVTINAGADGDRITNTGSNVSINGGSGNDTINASSGEDVTVNGGRGDDLITLPSGASVLQYASGDGRDTVTGVNGNTRLDFDYDAVTQTGADVVMTIGNGSITFKNTALITVSPQLIGTANADSLVNDVDTRHILAKAGDDTIENSGSSLRIEAGDGNNRITTGGSNVTLASNAGDDVIINSGSNVTLLSGGGADTVTNSGERVRTYGNSGDDVITNSGANSRTYGNSGDDVIENSGSKAYIDGGADNDTVVNSGADAVMYGSEGDDSIVNSGTGAFIVGNAGDDTITNDADNAVIYGGADNDVIENRGSGADLDGGEGDDTVTNSGANVSIRGGYGNDVISLNGGSEMIIYWTEGAGDDTIYGYSDRSLLIFAGSAGIEDGLKYDALEQSGSDAVMKVGSGSMTFKDTDMLTFIPKVVGTNGADSLINTTDEIYVSVGAGDDTVVNSGLNVTINGGAGNDVISLDGGSARIDYRSGGGNDTVYGFDDNATLGFDYDSIEQRGSDVVMKVGSGSITFKDADVLTFMPLVVGTDDADSIANATDGVYVSVGAGDDTVVNDGLNVTINGGAGNDVISLNEGAEVIRYELGDGDDTIYGLTERTVLDFTCDSIPRVTGSDLIMYVGKGSVTFKGVDIRGLMKKMIGSTTSGQSFNNWLGSNTAITGSAGDDTISNGGSPATIDAGAGNDLIENTGLRAVVNGGDGNDAIMNEGGLATITGGRGNDVIMLAGGYEVINYASGDGDDTIIGFDGRRELNFEYDSIEQRGVNVLMTIGDGSITFKNTSIDMFNVGGNGQLAATDELASIIEPSAPLDLDEPLELGQSSALDKILAVGMKKAEGRLK